ncbi:MAG: radical SAM protein [Magnetococcales bacterium]|nr:radical SAM protein [Magnetococcales bacterium]
MKDPYAIDSHKMIYHPKRTAEVLEAGDNWEKARSVYPIYVEISPIGTCNHRCRFCAVDYVGYKPDRLRLPIMAQRLPEMAQLGVKSVNFAGEGEPFLNKNLGAMILIARDSGLDVSLTTNASIMPKTFPAEVLWALSWLKVSINAGAAETYAHIHQTRPEDFDRVLDNMRAMVQAKRAMNLSCTLGAQSLLLPDNVGEMEQLADICKEIGMDYLVIKPYSQHLSSGNREYAKIDYNHYFAVGELLREKSDDHFSLIFREESMRLATDEIRYDTCYATPYLWAHIMANGVVSGCSAFLLDDRFEYGDINQNNFQEIWEGERRKEGLRFVREALDITQCRQNCRMDKVNRYLHAIQIKVPMMMNFIPNIFEP